MPRPKKSSGPSTRDRIRDAAIELFSRKGFTATSTREVCEEVGVTKPVLYDYFKGKKELFCTAVLEGVREFTEGMHSAAAINGTAEERMAEVVWNDFKCTRQNPAHLRLVYRVVFGQEEVIQPKTMVSTALEKLKVLMQIAADGIHSGELAGSPHEIAMSLIGLSQIHTLRYLVTGEGELSKEDAQRCVEIVLRGCRHTKQETRVRSGRHPVRDPKAAHV